MGDQGNATPLVDLIIAIHDPDRPLERGIRSLFDQGLMLGSELRVSVVCHNLEITEVRSRLSEETRAAVRFLDLKDGIPSPAGPFNLGVSEATAKYVSIMGSDDLLESGAVKAWLERAERGAFAAVIAPIRLADGSPVRTPPTRPWRGRALHPVRDRLSYRSAPLGLVRRDVLERLGLTFAPGLSTGEDQLLCLKLWFSGEPIAYGRGEPRYLGGDGAASRVTLTRRPLQDDYRALEGIVGDPWFAGLILRNRRAIAAKLTRVHVFAAAASRPDEESWVSGEREYLAGFIARLRLVAPGFERPFSIADRKLIDSLVDQTSEAGIIASHVAARRRFGSPATLLTRSLRGQFAVEGPLRFMAASVLV